MESFRKQLKNKILSLLALNIVISFIVLLISYPFVPKSAGTEAYGFTMLFFFLQLIVLALFWSTGLISFFLINRSYNKSKLEISLRFLLLPAIGIIFISGGLSDLFFDITYISSYLLFFLGQLFSLFLILKFIEKNKPTQNSKLITHHSKLKKWTT